VVARFPCFVVADGMGGHDRGDRASAIVAEELAVLAGRVDLGVEEVRDSLARARRRIAEVAGRDQRHAPGTTVSGLVQVVQEGEPYWLVVNLGDSRTYRFADGLLARITEDHSEVQELVRARRLTAAQARTHPRRHVVTKALGAGIMSDPDFTAVPARAGDRLLVCSDGLTEHVGDMRIAHTLRGHRDPGDAAAALMRLALAAGGKDNVTVVVVDLSDDPAGPPTAFAQPTDDQTAPLPSPR
jgi:protein phosphatase